MDVVFAWLQEPTWGISRWVLLLLFLITVAEWMLGRSQHPQLRSIAALLATLLKFAVVKSRVALVPVVGPILVSVLELISGEDLDGDGRIASRAQALTQEDRGPGR